MRKRWLGRIYSRLKTLGVSDGGNSEGTAVADDALELEQEIKRLALRQVFQQGNFSVLDGLNEYDDDFTAFSARGDLITHDMMRMAQRLTDASESESMATQQETELDAEQDEPKSA